jgi:RNA polymerase sigma-70 factor (ECF subfamily)
MQSDSARLAEGLHSGDPDVLDDLIVRYQHRLYRYLLFVTGNRSASDDFFQETWMRVLERGRQYRPQWRFDVWLFSIARHLVIDAARRKKGISLEELTDSESGTGFEPAAGGLSPLQQLLAGEAGERVARVLDRISPLYREVLTLRFHEELTLEEVAEIVDAPVPTVKSRLYRGLEALRRLMEVEEK